MNKIYDLIYMADVEDYKKVCEIAEEAGYEVSDGSEPFRPNRLVFEKEVNDREEHYIWLFMNGLHKHSLDLQVLRELEPDEYMRLLRLAVKITQEQKENHEQ